MSTYDDVKAEFGAGPPMAIRSNFTTYFGYRAGVTLGTFPTKADATNAGATLTEPLFDEAGYKAANDAYRAHWCAVEKVYCDRLRADSPLNDAVFGIVYGEAYERGHSSGHDEVEAYLDTFTDFAQRIIAASK